MKRLILFSILCSIILSCKESKHETKEQLIGNWFFIDKNTGGLFEYQEVYIDSSIIHFNLGGHQMPPPFRYTIRHDTLYFTDFGIDPRPVWVIKEVKPDTLIVEFLDKSDKSNRTLKVVRLGETEKLAMDYKDLGGEKDDNLIAVINNDYMRRFEEYQVKSGLTTWDEIEKWKADSSNYVTFPASEFELEEKDNN